MDRTDDQQPLSLDSQADEDRVRRALGLKTNGSHQTHQQRPEQARQRHRFVSDGAVPVVMLNRTERDSSGLKEKLTAIEHALENERTAHIASRRALSEAQTSIQALQTRLGHAELAHNEALATERDARRAAEEALATLRATTAELPAPPLVRETAPEPKPERAIRKPRAPRPEVEQKPVRWWTPSFRAKRQG